jgi:hypothetical protein
MVSMWKHMEAMSSEREITMVADTCFHHLERVLRATSNLEEFRKEVLVDVKLVRNSYLNLRVQKKRFSSTPIAKQIQKNVLKDIPHLLKKMANSYLSRGHWFRAKQEGSIYIMLQDDLFRYGYYMIRTPHVDSSDLVYSSIRA